MHSLIRSVAVVVALMVASVVPAAELIVPTQYPTIQAAINASVSGDIVTVRPGIYNERLDIGGRNITLRSLLGPNATFIDPQGVGGVVINSSNAAANGWVLQGFTIRNGLDSALYVSGVTATVRNCKFINNQASRGGGAHVRAGSDVTFENCEFTQNKANSGERKGGALFVESATALAKQCIFASNEARLPTGGYYGDYVQRGGAVANVGGSVTVEDSVSSGNQAVFEWENASCENGGTFFCWGGFASVEGGSLTLRRHSSTQDRAFVRIIDQGGVCGDRTSFGEVRAGFVFSANATVSVEDTILNGTRAEAIGQGGCCYYNDVYSRGYGGAFFLAGGSAAITRCTVDGPSVTRTWLGGAGGPQESNGGFIYHEAGSLSLIDTVVRNASAPSFGGAIRTVTGAGLSISGSRFENCVSGNVGGAIAASVAAPSTISGTTFIGCRSDSANGGAIWLTAGTRNFANCTFTNNIAQGGGDHRGGAIFAEGGAQLNFTDCGFTGNRALSTGDNADRSTWGGACAMFGVTPRYTRCNFTDNAAISTGNGGGWRRAHGGATAEYDSDAIFTDCVFTGNRAEVIGNGAQWSRGGTVHLWNSDSDFVRTTITDGRALPLAGNTRGGGVWMENVSRPGFTYCTITDSDANEGGALYIESSEPYFVSTAFRRNTANTAGGAMLVDGGSTPYILECEFEQNTAPLGGAVRTLGSGTNLPFIVNSSFCGNTADAINGPILGGEGNVTTATCSTDCNGNGIPDADEIAAGAPDVDANGILDSCQTDCNANGLPDAYELGQNTVSDCNGNGTPDSCDIASGLSGDANSNGVPDECELTSARLVPFEYGSITAAINAAQSGDTIFLAPGAYYEKFSFGNKQLTLKSVGGAAVTYIDGNGQNGTLLTINGGQTTASVVDGITFWYAQGGYAIYIQNASPTVRNCRFLFNQVADGAAFRIDAPSSAEIFDCLVEANTGYSTGGGLWTNANPVFTRTTFKNNIAGGSGGAARLQGGTARFVDCDFLGNRAQGGGDHRGGAVSASNTTNVSFSACVFEDNLATSNGDHADRYAIGGACAFNDCAVSGATPPATFSSCTFDGNIARATGNHGGTRVAIAGAVYDYNSDLAYLNCNFLGNQAVTTSNAARRSWAGGMYSTFSNPDLDGCVFDANSTVSNDGGESLGGAIYYEGASNGFIDKTMFKANSARRGGAAYMTGNSQPDYAGCDFDGNAATDRGGAVYANIAPSFFFDCGFRRNTAAASGGSLLYSEGVTGPIIYGSVICGHAAPSVVGNWGNFKNAISAVCADCNANGIEDVSDLASGASLDCNGNAVPDECEPDTDGDGKIDACDGCPSDPLKFAPGACGCGVADTDSDGDGTPNCLDGCPNNPAKTAPGVCGCGVADTDTDGDGTPNCNDQCPNDPAKIAPGTCGCGVADTDSDGDGTPNCNDQCPNDPAKIAPGACGCGVADTDSDGDGTPNCLDGCPNNPAKTAPGVCGCGVADTDSDGDGTPNCNDQCPNDPAKIAPGTCGCGVADTDSDGDGTPNCNDGCPTDPAKIAPGTCGCGVAETDSDGDGTPNCNDGCPNDPAKIAPGTCGCGVADTDSDGDGTPNCNDGCPNDPAKIAPGTCGCGVADTDSDGDGTPNCNDGCPNDPAKIAPGTCGCGVADTDSDGDGTPNCNDGCPNDPAKIAPGTCGCGVADTDSDGDGTPNCNDGCPNDPLKLAPGACGCGVADSDSDGDGVANCIDNCPSTSNPNQSDCNNDGIGDACTSGTDCNGNGRLDSCDLAEGTSTDLNGNGVPDDCAGEFVVGGSGYSTIAAAVAAAPSGTQIEVGPGVYTGAVSLTTKSAKLKSIAGAGQTVLSGVGLDVSIITIRGAASNNTIIDGFTLRDGPVGTAEFGTRLGGAIVCIQTNAIIRNCRFVNNSSAYGGAIYAYDLSGSISNCVFEENHGTVGPGAVQVGFGGTVDLANNQYLNNTAGQDGGAVAVVQWFEGPITTATIRNSIFRGNSAVRFGGALNWYAGIGADLPISDCIVESNSSTGPVFARVQESTSATLRFAIADSRFCLNTGGNVDTPYLDQGGNAFGDDCNANGICDLDDIVAGAADVNANLQLDSCEQAGGDFDLDGVVGGGDLAFMLSVWGPAPSSPADLTGDGLVSAEDLALFLSFWGN